MRSHPHAEEKAPEHPELHAGSAQERPLETPGPAGKHQQHMDALQQAIRHILKSDELNNRLAALRTLLHLKCDPSSKQYRTCITVLTVKDLR